MLFLHRTIRIALLLPPILLAFVFIASQTSAWREGEKIDTWHNGVHITGTTSPIKVTDDGWEKLIAAAALGAVLHVLYSQTSFYKKWQHVEDECEKVRLEKEEESKRAREAANWAAGAGKRQEKAWKWQLEEAEAAEQGKGGEPVSYRKAFELRLEIAKEGCAEARGLVARAYISGKGVQADAIEGLAWLYCLGEKMEKIDRRLLDEVEARIGHRGVEEAQARARQLLPNEAGSETLASAPPRRKRQSANPVAQMIGTGSGAIVSETGHVLTAAHVLKNASAAKVVFGKKVLEAEIVAIDTANDVALLHVSKIKTPSPRLSLGQLETARMGQACCTIGFPSPKVQGSAPKCTDGIISSEDGPAGDIRFWQVSCPIQPGNSGGPLLDEYGRLIGIVVSTLNSARFYETTGAIPQNVNYAIKATYAFPMLAKHGISLSPGPADPAKFDEMVARSLRSCVLIQVY